MAEIILELKHVVKVFGKNTIINDVNLDIEKGQFVTFLGPSGCGKTTLLRMIAGFYTTDSGEILLNGEKIDNLPPHKRGTPMVFQEYALFPHMSVYENISYGLKNRKLSRNEIEEKVTKVLELMKLTEYRKRQPNQLSGGQQQRVAIARALVMDSSILLLDEPLSNLDAKLRESVRIELRLLQQQLGINMIYVTHDQSEALAMSDKIVVMDKGVIHQYAVPKEIYHRPATKFVADFIGVTNFINGSVAEVNGDFLTLDAGKYKIIARNTGNFKPGDRAAVSIRPVCIDISKTRQDSVNIIKGTIKYAMFLGDKVQYMVMDDAGKEWLIDKISSEEEILSGDVYLSAAPEKTFAIGEK